jgi:3-methyladenine DNA glycosylase/8-oxoguanine DNA glycosylase
VSKDLERLMTEMDAVAEYWSGVDTDLKYIDDQAKKLRDDRRLQMKIKSLNRDWEGVARDHKGYITAVRAILHEHVRYLLFFSSTRS